MRVPSVYRVNHDVIFTWLALSATQNMIVPYIYISFAFLLFMLNFENILILGKKKCLRITYIIIYIRTCIVILILFNFYFFNFFSIYSLYIFSNIFYIMFFTCFISYFIIYFIFSNIKLSILIN